MSETKPVDASITNNEAAAICAYALARLEHEALGYEKQLEAFDDLGEKFCVKRNTIKNFRDSFDPYTSSSRAGWHQHDEPRPSYLKDVKDKWSSASDSELIAVVSELKSWTWLPDLGAIWADCEKELLTEKDAAELSVPESVSKRIADFLSNQRGYTIDSISETAMHITSETNKQKSIISFAVLSKLKKVLPFLSAISKYKDAADRVLNDLQTIMPSGSTEQAVSDAIKLERLDNSSLQNLLIQKFGSAHSATNLKRAIRDEAWSGLKKSIFRSKKDVLNSVCLNKLNFENVKTGYIENLIDYYIESGDTLNEVDSGTSGGEPIISSVSPELDRNIIFFGAPGTGKSFEAEKYAGSKYIERVVFHADYQNSDFIGYLQPQPDKTHGATYNFEIGPLLKAIKNAFKYPDQPVVLLIEEMNRGNAPAIFGDLFQLLDRNTRGESQYKVGLSPSILKEMDDVEEIKRDQRIWLPSNLFIVGTMNSSDQGVFPLDTAFKRRFSFKYLPIDFKKHTSKLEFTSQKINFGGSGYTWSGFAQAINEVLLDAKVTEDKLLGPYFLSPAELSRSNLNALVTQKICFYLWDDVLRHEDKSIIFDAGLRALSDIQKKFDAGENIFSTAVMDYLNEFSEEHEAEEMKSDSTEN